MLCLSVIDLYAIDPLAIFEPLVISAKIIVQVQLHHQQAQSSNTILHIEALFQLLHNF